MGKYNVFLHYVNVVYKYIFSVTSYIEIIVTLLMVLLVSITVFARYFFGITWAGMDELIRLSMIWMVFLGLALLSIENDHITIDTIYSKLPAMMRKYINIIIGLTSISVSLFLFFVSYRMVSNLMFIGQRSPSGAFPAYLGYLALCIGMLLTAIAYVKFIVMTINNKLKTR